MKLISNIKEYAPLCIIGAIVAGTISGSLYYNFGPDSRRTLNPKGAVMEYTFPTDYKRIINASSGVSEGDMILTYENLEGKIISKEYDRLGLFETTVKWKEPEEKAEKDNKE